MRWLTPVAFGCLCAALILSPSKGALARDNGQWGDGPLAQWYRGLMQPDQVVSCCGDADAYQADDWTGNKDGSFDVTITDDRGNPAHRIGETFHVPANKVQDRQGNPTGHTIIFLSASGHTYCLVPGGGV